MVELLLIGTILLFFIFPLPVAAATLGIWNTWFLYQKYYLFRHQPPEGRKNLWLQLFTYLANFTASLLLGLAIALTVHTLIFTHIYLFVFNFIFCFLISLRWFDFSHLIFRHYILKWKSMPMEESSPEIFVEWLGLQKNPGTGFGWVPVFTDAGLLSLRDSELVLDGVFCKQKFSPATVARVEKKSLDKIRVVLRGKNRLPAEVVVITLKEQFYPFKSREKRDTLYKRMLEFQPA